MQTAALKRFMPFLGWRRPAWPEARDDLFAGIAVSLLVIPQSLAYAELAGVPAYFGLYAALIPPVVGVLFGSSAILSTGPVALTSLLTAASVGQISAPGSEAFVANVMLLALLSGVFQIALGLARAGILLNLLSHPVLVGFINAAAIVIAMSQLPALTGISVGHAGGVLLSTWRLLMNVGSVHWMTLAFGVLALALLIVFRRFAPRKPGVLAMVVVLTILSQALNFADHGGAIVGAVPAGLPGLSVPAMSWPTLVTLVPAAFVIALVSFMEAMSSCKVIAIKTRTRWDENQELIGQGLANIVGSLTQAFPVSGSFSRSAVNINAGAATGMSSVFTGLLVLLTLLFLTPLLYHLPQAVLAAVIIMAVIGLINVAAVKHAWQANRHDGIAAVVTFLATLGFAPHLDNGILVGAGLAIGLYLYRTMWPRVAILGRYHDGTLRDAKVNSLPASDVVTAVRFDGRLYFANVSYFEDAILEAVAANPKAPFLLIVADGVNEMDASGEEVVHHIVDRLRGNGVTVVFSGLKKQVIDVMRATGLFDVITQANIFATADQALTAIYARAGHAEADALRPDNMLAVG